MGGSITVPIGYNGRMRRILLALLFVLIFASCTTLGGFIGGGGGEAVTASSGMNMGQLLLQFFASLPELMWAFGALISSAVGGLVVLSIFFRNARHAMGETLKTIFQAFTYRVRKWQYKKKEDSLTKEEEEVILPEDERQM